MDGVEIAPIRSESTAALIARKLRELISDGSFGSGQQLFEVELAKRFGVSRGILREAMQRLTQEGLLISRPNRGVFVAEFGPVEVFDIFTARLAVERAACLKVIDVLKASAHLADELDELTDRLESRLADGASDSELLGLDIEFHECMVRAAKSKRLSRMHATLATESRMSSAGLDEREYPISDRIAEHREIAGAIRDRDVPNLHRLLAQHMDRAIESIVHGLDLVGESAQA